MNQATDDLGLPGCVEPSRLGQHVVQADDDLAADRIFGSGVRGLGSWLAGFEISVLACGLIGGVVESDHIGRAAMFQIALIQFGHFRRAHQVNAERVVVQAGKLRQQSAGDPTKQGEAQGAAALAVAQDQFTHCVFRGVPRRR